MFILTILETIKETRLKFSQGTVTLLQKMANYQEATFKLTNTQIKKLKSAAKNEVVTILRINKKNFEDEELPHELFLTAKQAIKIRGAFGNNMSTDIKLSKAQMSKINQSFESFGFWFANLSKKY